MDFYGTKSKTILFLSLLIGFANPSLAIPITYSFTGTATSTSGNFSGQGTTDVTGNFSFDDGLINTFGPNTTDVFRGGNLFTSSLTIGLMTVSAGGPGSGLLRVDDSPSLERIQFALFAGSNFELLFSDTNIPFDGVAAGSGNLIGDIALPISILNNLDFTIFNSSVGRWFEVINGSIVGFVEFDVTEVSRTQTAEVSAPSTLALFLLSLTGLGLSRGKR